MKVAPCSVSGRVEKTVIFSSRPSISKSMSAPTERPIQLRCICSTLCGQKPSSWLRSSSRRSAYSVILKYHCVSFFLTTS